MTHRLADSLTNRLPARARRLRAPAIGCALHAADPLAPRPHTLGLPCFPVLSLSRCSPELVQSAEHHVGVTSRNKQSTVTPITMERALAIIKEELSVQQQRA